MRRYLLFILTLMIALIISVPLLSAQEPHSAAPQAQVATPTPIQLVPNLPVSDTVSPVSTERVYTANALSSCPLQIIVTSDLPESGPRLVLENGLTGEVLALLGPQMVEGTFTLPPTGLSVNLRIYHSGSTFDEPFTIVLQDVCELEDKDRVTTGACTLIAFRNYPVNVRSLPRVDSALVTTLPPEVAAPVLRRTDDNQWWEISLQGQVGWVSRSVSERSGDCTAITSIPSIRPTYTPTPEATYTYTPSATGPTYTPSMTYTPSETFDGPTYTPTETHDGPTFTPTETPTETHDGPTFTPTETPTETPTP